VLFRAKGKVGNMLVFMMPEGNSFSFSNEFSFLKCFICCTLNDIVIYFVLFMYEKLLNMFFRLFSKNVQKPL